MNIGIAIRFWKVRLWYWKKCNVHPNTIRRIKRHVAWRHLRNKIKMEN